MRASRYRAFSRHSVPSTAEATPPAALHLPGVGGRPSLEDPPRGALLGGGSSEASVLPSWLMIHLPPKGGDRGGPIELFSPSAHKVNNPPEKPLSKR